MEKEKTPKEFIFDPLKNPTDLDFFCKAFSATKGVADRKNGYKISILGNKPEDAQIFDFANPGVMQNQHHFYEYEKDIRYVLLQILDVLELNFTEYWCNSIYLRYYKLKGGKLEYPAQLWFHQ